MIKYFGTTGHYSDNEQFYASEGEIVREIISLTKCNAGTAKKIIAMVKKSK